MTKYEEYLKQRLESIQRLRECRVAVSSDNDDLMAAVGIGKISIIFGAYTQGQIDLIKELLAMPSDEPIKCTDCGYTNRDYGCNQCNPYKRETND